MTDNTELQRLIRLHRLARQIAASSPADLDREQAFQGARLRALVACGSTETREQASIEQGGAARAA